MPIDVERALEICEAATPGPWHAGDWTHIPDGRPKVFSDAWECVVFGDEQHARTEDCEFAAHAREGYPAALRRVQELESRLTRLRELLAGVYRVDCVGTLGSIQGDVTLLEDDLTELRELLEK